MNWYDQKTAAGKWFDPNNPRGVVPPGDYYAIQTRDGRVYYVLDADNHYEAIRQSGARQRDIVSTGWLRDGVFSKKPWGDPFQLREERTPNMAGNWYRLLKIANLPSQAPLGVWIAPDGTIIPTIRHELTAMIPPPKGLGIRGGEQAALAAGYIRGVVGRGGNDRTFNGLVKPNKSQIDAICNVLMTYGFNRVMLEFPQIQGIYNDLTEIEKALKCRDVRKGPNNLCMPGATV